MSVQGEQICGLLTKYPVAHCRQVVEPVLEQLVHCSIAEEQGKQVEELVVRYNPAVLLHTQFEGVTSMNGDWQARHPEAVH